jgi:hypothetical protein
VEGRGGRRQRPKSGTGEEVAVEGQAVKATDATAQTARTTKPTAKTANTTDPAVLQLKDSIEKGEVEKVLATVRR